MNTGTVNKTCRELFVAMAGVLPPMVYSKLTSKGYLAGGIIRSLVLGEDVRDVDVWLKDESLVEELKALEGVHVSANAINFYVEGIPYQIVTRNIAEPRDMINSFDFKMNMNFYDYQNKDLVIDHIEVIKAKSLEVNRECRNQLGTLGRIPKFTNRGYSAPSKVDMMFLASKISKLDIVTFSDLEEQSQLYFGEAEFDDCNFVNRPTEDGGLSAVVMKPAYHRTRSGSSNANSGSAI